MGFFYPPLVRFGNFPGFSVPDVVILTRDHLLSAFDARDEGRSSVELSPDLGITRVVARIAPEGVVFPNSELLNWAQAEAVLEAEHACFRLRAGCLEKIQIFSPTVQRHYVLYSTRRAPTFLNSGIPMHRIKDTDPTADTEAKIDAARPIFGKVLDTCTGLGYTAIAAARTAAEVTTIEIDPAVIELARVNPWSRELFDNPKIIQKIGDVRDLIVTHEPLTFSRVLHDPPAFNIAGELYSVDFYRELHRVLTNSGRLFHYIGNLDSPSGRRVARGAAERLLKAGFSRVEPCKKAFGLLAYH